VKPSSPAMIETTRKIRAHFNSDIAVAFWVEPRPPGPVPEDTL
jgi:hypothetical protein